MTTLIIVSLCTFMLGAIIGISVGLNAGYARASSWLIAREAQLRAKAGDVAAMIELPGVQRTMRDFIVRFRQ